MGAAGRARRGAREDDRLVPAEASVGRRVILSDDRPTIRLGWPDLGEQELSEVAEVLESGMLTMGPKVLEFEAEIARLCEVEHALAVTSGTAALHLAVLAAGLEPGDEVVVPAYTFPATANVVALSGLKPVLVDVDPETMNIDPAKIRVGPRTKLLLGVHLFGRPLPLHDLPERAAARGCCRRARRALPRPRLRRARHRRLSELPSAQDRHDRARAVRSPRPTTRLPTPCGSCETTAGAPSRRPTCRRPGSTTASRTSSARSASRRRAASASCSRRGRGSPTVTPSACAHLPRAAAPG